MKREVEKNKQKEVEILIKNAAQTVTVIIHLFQNLLRSQQPSKNGLLAWSGNNSQHMLSHRISLL
jgi:flavoprotein